MTRSNSLFGDYYVVSSIDVADREEKEISESIQHYHDINSDTWNKSISYAALTDVSKKLKKYLIDHPELTTYPFFKAGLSCLGVTTNQPYAKAAWENISLTLLHTAVKYEHKHYLVLTCLEKLLTLYLHNTKGRVSDSIIQLFDKLLKMKLPVTRDDKTRSSAKSMFTKIKNRIYSQFGVLDRDPDICIPDELIPKFSMLSLAEYHQARSTWLGAQLLSDQPQPSSSTLEPPPELKLIH